MKLQMPTYRRIVQIRCRITKRLLMEGNFPMGVNSEKAMQAAWIMFKRDADMPWRPRSLVKITVGVLSS